MTRPHSPNAPVDDRLQHVVVVYADLKDSVGLIRHLHASQHRDVRAHLEACARRVARRHGGVLAEAVGDAVLLMFGYTQPSEHDGRRAVEAALELHQLIGRVPTTWRFRAALSLHTGVHSGPALVERGPRRGFRISGVVPSTAQRLSSAATADQIFVSVTTLGGDVGFFLTEDRGRIDLKGLGPTPVVNVLELATQASRFEARARRGLAPFIGRQAELDVLAECLAEAARGTVVEVTISAAAGVGKTRLVEEFAQTRVGATAVVLRGSCEGYLAAKPLQPLLQIARQIEGAASDPARVPPMPGPPHAPGLDGSAPARACLELITQISRSAVVVLFIDDYQWADDLTRQALAALRLAQQGALLIVTASRQLEPDAGHGAARRLITLTPFSGGDSAAAIRQLLPTVDPFALRRIQNRSGGNALFIEELCHGAVDQRDDDSEPDSADVSAWIATLVQARVAGLPEQLGQVVRAAAVVGAVVPVSLLEQICGIRRDDGVLRELAERDLIFPGETEATVRFKHGLTRDVIYASLGLLEREDLHRRVAGLIAQSAPAGDDMTEALAYHYRGAGDAERTVYYATKAADRARKALALDRARDQCAAALTALDLLPDTPEHYDLRIRLIEEMGLCCVYDPAREHLHVFSQAVDRAAARHDHASLTKARYWLAFNHYALGELPAALIHYTRARAHCAEALAAARRSGDDALATSLHGRDTQIVATMGQVHAAAGDNDDALRVLDAALSVKQQYRRPGQAAVGSAYTLACKGAVLGDMGDFAGAHACFAEALETIEGHLSPVRGSILVWQSAVELWQGRWHEAIATAARAQRVAEQVASLYVLAMSQAAAAYGQWHVEGGSDAVQALLRATSWLDANRKHLFISINYAWLAELFEATGQPRPARAYVARAIHRGRRGDRLGLAAAYRVAARVASRAGDDRAGRYLERAMHAATARHSRREQALTAVDLARDAARRGDLHAAATHGVPARAALADMGMSWHERAAMSLLAGWPPTHSGAAGA